MPRPAGRILTTLTLGLALLPVAAAARTLEVGKDKQYSLPSEAASQARDGDHIALAPGEYFDCAVLRANNLVFEGTGPGATAVLTDKTCSGKGILVTTGNNITVRNVTLTRARVADMNGAGIRGEGRDLVVEGVKFINNQDGILAAGGSTLTVRDSEFVRNGICEGSCAHGIYVGDDSLVRIERTKFFETRQGHHIKSRAYRTEIIDCDIADGENGTASYEIDIPNGGSLVVRNTKFQKGPNAENHTAAIRVGAEGVTRPTPEITIEGSSFRNDGQKTIFLDNLTATEATLRGNRMSGPVQVLRGDGKVQ